MAHSDPMKMVRITLPLMRRAKALVPRVAARIRAQGEGDVPLPRVSTAAVVRMALAWGLTQLERELDGDRASQ